ncbi:MAG: hypothetical protein ABIJ00_15010 [Candidatus Eisenbacteria bacterium]
MMTTKTQVSKSKNGRRSPAEKRNEHFAKFMHALWDVALVQTYLTKRDDLLVLLAMLRYADFDTGECAVFIPRMMRDTGIKHANQVVRSMDKIEAMGAFRRLEGKKGFKNVYGKSVRRYFRATGEEIIAHAVANDLISEEKIREIELRQVEKEIQTEAEGGLGADAGGLDDFPETIDEILEHLRREGKE